MNSVAQRFPWAAWSVAMLMTVVFMPGCGEQQAPEKAAPTEKPAAESAEPAKPTAAAPKPAAKPATPPANLKAAVDEPDPKVTAMLAKADAVDGKTDKIVSKCTGCGLGMDGDAKFTSAVGGYKLHLCSKECKGEVDKDLAKAILALKIPEPAEKK